jgi:hypothetical protein
MVILVPHDVIFVQVAARLQLDNFKRDVSGLIFGHGKHLVAVGDFSGTRDHDTVLGTVMVLLQSQAGFTLYLNPLDLEAATFVNAVIQTPGAMYFKMQVLLFAFLDSQQVDDMFDVLAARLVRHHYGIRS